MFSLLEQPAYEVARSSFTMCHGHPHYHPCSHTSVKWLYCPEAIFDLSTGYETPCANPIYSTAQPVNSDCPLKNCNFKALKGSWNCCVCGQGPNTQGWCTAATRAMNWDPVMKRMENMDVPCGHGCCSQCSRYRSLPLYKKALRAVLIG